MIKKLLKIFDFSLLLKNKKKLFCFLFLFLFANLFFYQLSPVQAQTPWDFDIDNPTITPSTSAESEPGWMDTLWSLPESIVSTLIGAVPWAIGMVTLTFATLTSSLARWVLSDNFINISYTNPADNPIIATGLSVTQGFVNMTLVLVLVWIALATILRLDKYQDRKILVTFIIIALLVNFAPVICGLIVDAGNISMNFFLNALAGDNGETSVGANLVSKAKDSFDKEAAGLWEATSSAGTRDSTRAGLMEKVGKITALAIINFIMAIVYLLFALIFAVRYIAIWILVILSPLAFVSYILPATQKYFNIWWNQMIQWSLIGVTCMFFLYLGETLASQTDKLGYSVANLSTGASIFIFVVPVAFLFIGLLFGLQTSAMGAGALTTIGARAPQKAMGWLGYKAPKRAMGWMGKKVWGGAKPWIEEQTKIKDLAGWASKTVTEKIPIARWFFPQKIKDYGEIRPDVLKSQEEAKKYSTPTNLTDVFTKKVIGKEAAGRLKQTIDVGDADDIFKDGKKYFGKGIAERLGKNVKDVTDNDLMEDKEFKKIMESPFQSLFKSGFLSSFLRSDPRLAAIAAGQNIPGYKTLSPKQSIQKALEESRGQHIAKMEPGTLKNINIIEPAMAEFDKDRWIQIHRTVKQGQKASMEGMNKAYSEFLNKNKDLMNKIGEHQEGDASMDKETGMDDAVREYVKYLEKEYGKAGYFKGLSDPKMWGNDWKAPQYLASLVSDSSKSTPPGGGSQYTPGAGAGTTPPSKKKHPFGMGIGSGSGKKPKGTTGPGGYKRPPKGKK
ncbi:MAG: hypothetical protein ABH956_00710 [Candidatus Nealsonbacteria bacterium]